MNKARETQGMTPEAFLGEECAQALREMLRYTRQATLEERLILLECLRKKASEQPEEIVSRVLTVISERIKKATEVSA